MSGGPGPLPGTNRTRLLVVDDEPQIRKFLRISLGAHGYEVIEASSGEEAVAKSATENIDLVILDLGLPGLDGHGVIQRIREWSQMPIIVLSVRAGDVEKVQALDGGAEDYLTKPFSIAELMARIRAALRKRGAGEAREAVFTHRDLSIDLGRRKVALDGKEIRLSRKEYGLLRLLATHPGRVLTHQQLLRELWGPAHLEDTHYLRIHIGHLRQKLGDDPAKPRYILTEPGVGYRLAEDG
jgi:two-component system KDP operon response regulator KdpE